MTTSPARVGSPIPTRGDLLPGFSGETPTGDKIRLRDFYMRRNLALVFTDGPDYAATRDLLRGLVERRAAVHAEAGETLAVISGDPSTVRDLAATLEISFPVVVDGDNAIHQRYGLVDASGEPCAAIFLADRFGTVFEASLATDEQPIMGADEVPGWLEFIACRCT
ncbi:MAG TPA: redoxin domain-containing protein [Nitrolancea sp.]|nr:redoxin domain-containing protein [Nitrolancea sp.]